MIEHEKKTKHTRGGKTVQKDIRRLLLTGTFIVLFALIWMDEILDLPHYLLGAPPTPVNWLELLLETILIAGVAFFTFREIAKRKKVEEQIRHLNRVLRAIRDVNQLIIRERDRDRMLRAVCNVLVETGAYYNAWIALLDEAGGYLTSAEAGLGKKFLPMVNLLERGELVACARSALKKSGIIIFQDPFSTCTDCPLADNYADRVAMTIRLEGGGKVCGLLTVSIPRDFTAEDEEQRLLVEVAADIGYALLAIEQEEERKRVEGELKGSEERYRFLLESVTVGVQVLDREFRHLLVNDKLASISQMPKEKLIGSKMTDLFPGVEETAFFKVYKEVLETGEPQVVSDEFVFEDGRRAWLEMHVYPTPEGILVMVSDVTERKSLEQQLLQSQKMEAIGRLAGGVAHDFNNILTVITGNAELILAELPEDSPYRDRILNMRKAADHATGLTRQLLAFSRRQIVSPRILSINKVISDLHGMLQRVIGEDIQLVTHLGEDAGNIRIDPGQIEQVLMNLVVNAREAMPGGGIIAIETEQVELDEAYVNTHPYVRPGPYVQISVSDTGSGMSDEVRGKVFEPFFTTKEGGTGLGMSTVYGIVKQNEGSINVYSEEGIGTTFKIYFSITKERADADPTGVGKADLLTGSETILVVEDDNALRDLAVEILTDLGYRVHAFSDAEEALFSVRESEETIDLLLTDVVMPGLSGVELANAVLEADPSVRVLYMSGYTDNAIAYHGVLDEAVNLLHKPFNLTEIAKKVREVLDA